VLLSPPLSQQLFDSLAAFFVSFLQQLFPHAMAFVVGSRPKTNTKRAGKKIFASNFIVKFNRKIRGNIAF
jgi:hypothetical protein